MKFIEVIDRLEKGIFTDGTIIESNFGESYNFSERDGHFHRCNKRTKNGQVCQPFMRTENINKTYVITGITVKNTESTIITENDSIKQNLLEIINYYGIMKQLKYIHSEYFELDEAIINMLDDEFKYYSEVESSHKKHVAEEIADIMVMIKQFQYYFEITDEKIKEIMNYKIERQLDRINNEIEKGEI